MYSIYKLTDPNGLVYIGCTKQSVKARLHGTYNKKLMAAFKKYGINSFVVDIIATTNSAAEAKQIEEENIKKYKSFDSQRGYNANSFSGYSSQDKEPTELKAFRATEKEAEFLTTALKWFRAQTILKEIGTIKEIPNIFTNGAPIQQVSPTGIVSGGTVELPQFVEDVLNGGSYPNPEDCTQEERDVLYNQMFQEYYKRYISTKDDKSRGLLREIIAEFIEHNFPMLEKDTK